MSVRYLYQIILCSQREGRVWRREIAVSPAEALVTKIEAMPPGYHMALAQMRAENEKVYEFHVKLKCAHDCRACPFCGQRAIIECDYCGAISCVSIETDHHCCPNPGCQKVYSVIDDNGPPFKASASGWVHRPGRLERGPVSGPAIDVEPSRPYPVPRGRQETGLVPRGQQESGLVPTNRDKLRQWLEKKDKG